MHTKLGLIYPAYKVGFVSYIPKPNAHNTQPPNLRLVILLPIFFKILRKYITFVVFEVMRETIKGLYSHTLFTFRMRMNPEVTSFWNANLKLTIMLEDSTHRRNKP